MRITRSFEFKTLKNQIEDQISDLRRSWNNASVGNKEWNEKYKKYKHTKLKVITEPYGLLVTVEIYNAIREIYLCDHPFPHDTTRLFGLEIYIMDNSNWGGIIITDKKGFDDAVHAKDGGSK